LPTQLRSQRAVRTPLLLPLLRLRHGSWTARHRVEHQPSSMSPSRRLDALWTLVNALITGRSQIQISPALPATGRLGMRRSRGTSCRIATCVVFESCGRVSGPSAKAWKMTLVRTRPTSRRPVMACSSSTRSRPADCRSGQTTGLTTRVTVAPDCRVLPEKALSSRKCRRDCIAGGYLAGDFPNVATRWFDQAYRRTRVEFAGGFSAPSQPSGWSRDVAYAKQLAAKFSRQIRERDPTDDAARVGLSSGDRRTDAVHLRSTQFRVVATITSN
jgi:hypothetical protein